MPLKLTTQERVILVVTLDPGSSLTKIIYQVIVDGSSSELKILSMQPELMQVTSRRIEDYEAVRWTSTDPAEEAWVESLGEYYAVGFLAKQFCGNAGWNELKYERAAIKLLAAIGVIAFREGLPDKFDLALTVLLPYKEYKDAHKFESEVSEALANFSFRNRWHSVNLWMFDCKGSVAKNDRVKQFFQRKSFYPHLMNPKTPFKWRHYQPEIILNSVRWYLRYPLSYRNLEEMMQERGLSVDHTTVYRWVQAYTPELDKRCRPHLKPTLDSWRVDET